MALSKGRRPPDHLLLTKVQTARALSLPVKAINKMISQGILEPVTPEGEIPVRFHVSDVAAVLEVIEKKTHLSKIWNRSLVADVRSKRVERKLDEVLTLLGAKEERLPTDQIAVERLFLKISNHLKRRNLHLLSADEVMKWARTFIQMDENYLKIAAHWLETQEPWFQPMLLGQKMLEQAPRELFSLRKDLEDVYGYLQAALRSFKHSAYFYCRILLGSARKAAAMFPEVQGDSTTRSIAQLIAMGMPDGVAHKLGPTDKSNRKRLAKPNQGRPTKHSHLH